MPSSFDRDFSELVAAAASPSTVGGLVAAAASPSASSCSAHPSVASSWCGDTPTLSSLSLAIPLKYVATAPSDTLSRTSCTCCAFRANRRCRVEIHKAHNAACEVLLLGRRQEEGYCRRKQSLDYGSNHSTTMRLPRGPEWRQQLSGGAASLAQRRASPDAWNRHRPAAPPWA